MNNISVYIILVWLISIVIFMSVYTPPRNCVETYELTVMSPHRGLGIDNNSDKVILCKRYE